VESRPGAARSSVERGSETGGQGPGRTPLSAAAPSGSAQQPDSGKRGPDDTSLSGAPRSGLAWPIVEAARPLLPPAIPFDLLPGLIGACFLSSASNPIFADLESLIVPGLLAAGIDATAEPLAAGTTAPSGPPASQPSLYSASMGSLPGLSAPAPPPDPRVLPAASGPVAPGLQPSSAIPGTPAPPRGLREDAPCRPAPLFRFHGEPFSEEMDESEALDEADPPPDRRTANDLERALAESGLLLGAAVTVAAQEDVVAWSDRAGAVHQTPARDLRERFGRALCMQRRAPRPTLRSALRAAVANGTLFALAYPDRRVTDRAHDVERRSEAAAFLAAAAGRLHDAVSLRWRRAAEAMAAGDADEAFDHLYDALLLGLGLPTAVRAALELPLDAPVTAPQRRELIYLARAGARPLRVMAAARLAQAAGHGDARRALEQLARSGEPLARAAAARALAAGCPQS